MGRGFVPFVGRGFRLKDVLKGSLRPKWTAKAPKPKLAINLRGLAHICLGLST